MAVSAPALADALAGIVGADHRVTAPAALGAAAIDGRVPRAIAWPGDVEEVSRLLALAAAERLAVAPRGSGAARELGAPPSRLDLVLDCSRLDAVLTHAAADMVASVQGGITLGALGGALARHRQRLPLDPIGGASRTLGGILACGSSGPLRFR
ncbi:MAG: FAD-binding protein, partial [Candidatus Rokubacteria bacterium]|nr:FAD-binding protein [Candidatus Rokubacteria bacterium]